MQSGRTESNHFSQVVSVCLSCHPLSLQHWAQETINRYHRMNKLKNLNVSNTLARFPLGRIVSNCKTDSNEREEPN